MQKYLFLLIAAICSFVATDAKAQQQYVNRGLATERAERNNSEFYVGLITGANFLSNQHHHHQKAVFNTGYMVGTNIGYRFLTFRVEGEFTYRHNSLDHIKYRHLTTKPSVRQNSNALLANGCWEMNLNSFVRPYIGAGCGYAWNEAILKVDLLKYTESDAGFAWQVMAGFSYDLTDRIELSAEYRYFRAIRSIEDQSAIFAAKYAL